METPESQQNLAPPKPRRRARRWILGAFILLVLVLVGGELVARHYYGLGDPPLSVFDKDMEYRFAPSKTYHRFGHLIHYNAYSQRADDFPEHKSQAGELRVMVIGDSVVNGGALLDQSQIFTQLLQRELTDALHRPVIVGNISAGSWGPPNELAYLKKFGLFDADVVMLVFNGDDAKDAMTFAPTVGVRADYPDHRPISALWEGIHRYSSLRAAAPPEPPVDPDKARQECLGAIREMVALARARGARVVIALHPDRPQVENGQINPGYAQIANVARELGIEPIEWQDEFIASSKAGHDPFHVNDGVHPDALGDQIIAQKLFPVVKDALLEASTKPASMQTH
jgi:lysophospholipase L1-like esterase